MNETSVELEKKVILVTGGSGLVGQAIKEKLEQHNHLNVQRKYKFVYLSRKDANLTSIDETRQVFDLYQPKFVINLAARVGGLYANIRENQAFYNDNISINKNVIQCAYENQVDKCISSLSTCIFPDKIDYPIDETKVSF